MNASALNTNLILLNSTSSRFPHGLGNDSGLLGKYVCHHNYRTGGEREDRRLRGQVLLRTQSDRVHPRQLPEPREAGHGLRRRLHDVHRRVPRARPSRRRDASAATYKDAQAQPGPWGIYMYMQGETIPKESNHVRLHETEKDQWGIPLLVTSVGYDDNDEKMIRDWRTRGEGDAGGRRAATTSRRTTTSQAPGLDIHEMGGCADGKDPKTSMLNEWNQLHALPERVRHRRRVHDVHRQPEPVDPLHGADRARGEPRRRRDGEAEPVTRGSRMPPMNRREAVKAATARAGRCADHVERLPRRVRARFHTACREGCSRSTTSP